MPIVDRYHEDGTLYHVRLRYCPLHYRVPANTVKELRAQYDAYPETNLWSGDPDSLMRSYHKFKRYTRDGKDWVVVTRPPNDWCLEIEATPDMGEVREVEPERAWELACKGSPVPLEYDTLAPDPRYRTVRHADGRREYYRTRFVPENFTAKDEIIERIRIESRGLGSKHHFASRWTSHNCRPGPFRNVEWGRDFGVPGDPWRRIYGYDRDSEYLLDVEYTDRPDFEIRRVPPRETYERIVASEKQRFPDLQLEDDMTSLPSVGE